MRFISKMLFLGLISLAVASCGGAPSAGAGAAQAATSTPVPTAPSAARPTYLVQRGDVQNIYDFTGRWQPRDQSLLAFQIAGTVRRVLVKQGDTITKNQLLADFQITNLEDQMASAKLNLQTALLNLQTGAVGSVNSVSDSQVALANANLNLSRTKLGNPWPSVESARIGLDDANASLLSAQRAYEDAISRPGNPASVIDGAFSSLTSAQNRLRSAQASYDSAAQNYATYQYSISTAQNGVVQAQINLDKAKSGATDPTKQQAVISAQLNVDTIQKQIDQSSLYAPIDGEVLDVTIKPGDAVKAFDVVITIGRLEPKEVVASLAIGDAQKMAIGMVGVCQVVNKPETAVQCVIRRVPLTAKDADQTTRIAATLKGVQTSQLVEVKMPLEIRSQVLWLPPAAVRTFQNRTFVVLQTPDGQKVADVTLGLRTDDRIEIQSGVNEGDIVVGP